MRLAESDEESGELLLRRNGNEGIPRSKLPGIASQYGIMVDCGDVRDMQFPEPSDYVAACGAVGSAEQQGDTPLYFAPPNVAEGGTLVQMFGPAHCIDRALKCLAGVTENLIKVSLPLGRRVFDTFFNSACRKTSLMNLFKKRKSNKNNCKVNERETRSC